MAASGIYVAGRGDAADPIGGLFLFHETATGWTRSRLAAVPKLSSLARHPELPVVYGTSGTADDGLLHAWRISAGRPAEPLSQVSSGGTDPCHVCVDPTGRSLIVCNYSSGVVAIWTLADDGAVDSPASSIVLQGNGSGGVPARQDRPHPHQAQFVGERLLVTDLGADCLWQFRIDPEHGLAEVARYPAPPGGGPRHLVQTATRAVAVSMELSGELSVSSPDLSRWHAVPSTLRSGPAISRSAANYPGDLQRSADGRIGYLANRGHDTVAAFALDDTPRLLAEVDAGVRWPQHLLVDGDRLLIAGEDSSQVVALPLDAAGLPLDHAGLPSRPAPLFTCPGACWLLPAG